MANAITLSIEQQVYTMKPMTPPAEQQADVTALCRLLENGRGEGHFRLLAPNGVGAAIPESMLWILARVAQVMASGDAVSVVPVNHQLTVQEAADILNVPSQYMMTLLDQSQVPFIDIEGEKRIHSKELLAYKDRRDQKRRVALDKMAELSQMYGEYEA